MTNQDIVIDGKTYRRVVGLTVDNKNVVGLTSGDSSIIGLNVDNPNIIPLTIPQVVSQFPLPEELPEEPRKIPELPVWLQKLRDP